MCLLRRGNPGLRRARAWLTRAVEPGTIDFWRYVEDVGPVMRLMKRVKYEQRTDLGNDVSFTFYDAGHILGSAYVVIEWEEAGARRTLLFRVRYGEDMSTLTKGWRGNPDWTPRPEDIAHFGLADRGPA